MSSFEAGQDLNPGNSEQIEKTLGYILLSKLVQYKLLLASPVSYNQMVIGGEL